MVTHLNMIRRFRPIEMCRELLSEGWSHFAQQLVNLPTPPGWPAVPAAPNPERLIVDGVEAVLHPIPLVYDKDKVESMEFGTVEFKVLRVGYAFLNSAMHRGYFPKAYYPKSYYSTANFWNSERPIIRLMRSPIADLSSVLEAVDVHSLEASISCYSYDGKKFEAGGRPLQNVLRNLMESDSFRRRDVEEGTELIDIRVHNVLQALTVDTRTSGFASLTHILDALALEVHGSWYWSGPKRIDFISRPYNEFIVHI